MSEKPWGMLKIELAIAVIGVCLMYSSFQLGWTEMSIVIFLSGITTCGFSLVLFGATFRVLERLRVVYDAVERFRDNKHGVIYIWLVCMIAIFVLGVIYFPCISAIYQIVDAITTSYNFPANQRNSMNVFLIACGWFLVIMTVGLIGWALTSSVKRQEPTYGY